MGQQVNHRENSSNTRFRIKKGGFLKLLLWLIVVFAIAFVPWLQVCDGESNTWEKKVSEIIWVAYAPTMANPNQGIEPTVESIREDLVLLRKTQFTGIVTYGSTGVLCRELPTIAKSLGFKGVIIGIWDPTNQQEMDAAKTAGKAPIVLGLCLGNEGLGKRYELAELSTAIEQLREATSKPVTTTEEIDDYSNERLLGLGDWVFPNAHPFFHNQLDPNAAVRWTKAAYEDLKKRSKRFVLFKEVGLPTAGDPKHVMSEAIQEKYYRELKKTSVQFVYFEAFDQPWKTHLPVEPHWGIFTADRTPKLLGKHLLGETSPQESDACFYVYYDANARKKNHFVPSGYMGDIGDVNVNENFRENPYSGESCIRVIYTTEGKGPYTCDYPPPCKWAGVYWQDPAKNWGTNPEWKERGFNLSGYQRLVFWARADKECLIEFKVGGIEGPYGDSLKQARQNRAKLTPSWQHYEINLKGADLKHIIGGFCWVTNWDTNPEGAIFYLDDIRFERETAVSLEKNHGSLLPFKSIGEPLSNRAIEFEKKVKTLNKGASRATVLKCLGQPISRWVLTPATSTEFELAPRLLVRGPDFRWGPELKKGEKKPYEGWRYEIDEGEQSISVSISHLSGTPHQEGATKMRVIRLYQLYFAEDSLEMVEVGLSGGSNSS